MEKKRTTFTALKPELLKDKLKSKESTKKAKGDCDTTESSSHTQFFRKQRHEKTYEKITRDQYFGLSESISGSSDSYHCVHGLERRTYSEKALLKRNIIKELDPIPRDPKWNDECPPGYGWDIAKKLEFLVSDPTADQQIDRLEGHLRDFATTSKIGYRIDILDSLISVIDYLVEALKKQPTLQEPLMLLLQNMNKPILLTASSDVVKHFDKIRSYIGFLGSILLKLLHTIIMCKEGNVSNARGSFTPFKLMASGLLTCGYLLMRLEDDKHFDVVSNAVLWHLSASDQLRGHGAVQLRHSLTAAGSVLYQAAVRMLAVTTSHRFPTFMKMALLLACENVENCMEMMKENIIENIFYRFNPYFPERKLPIYDINPADLDDYNVKLGDSSVNMSTTLSLLLVLVKTTKQFLEENPKHRLTLPCPDHYGQRCFVWAYRYECRAREHRHQRITLTVIAGALLNCFGDRLMAFSTLLMPDVLSLSVLSEVPPSSDWIRTVNFTTTQSDVQFKKVLISLSITFLKVFPYNKFMVETRHWLLGLMYLLDPGLCHLRARWSQTLFAELRKTALQALVCALPSTSPSLAKEYGLIRRIMWYIEWYSESPYELPVLYWCLRLLQVALAHRRSEPKSRKASLRDLFDTHGIIILIHLCYTLMEQKLPPVEKSQAILALSLRLLTSSVEADKRVVCCVYPNIKWPASINTLARKMLDVVLVSLNKNFIITDRWLISIMNFIWQGIIWKKEYREVFVANDGIYKLLDIITMTRAPVQCIALALVCDVARAGDAVGQLVSWRANIGAVNTYPNIVKRSSTIASLLAAIFRDECRKNGVQLNEYGVIQELDCPLMSQVIRKELSNSDFREAKNSRTSVCLAAADLAGSRLSKAYALLHMLSEDLEYRVSIADEAYNLYKNVKLDPEDEATLVLCSHYLTLKLGEVWTETQIQKPELLPQDEDILDEYLHISKGWAKKVQKQQENVIEHDRKKEYQAECTLYEFLGRVRLNIALDALREVRCVARSADRARITQALLHDAVHAHHRRSLFTKKLDSPVLRTYGPTLDDQNITGQNVKIDSIHPKDKSKPIDNLSSSSGSK